ncbi:MAG: hypothetical protein O3A96_15275 [Proteobacteria bacterium]|nr:hypothetical protein [Pseudomonadota bacterium]
MSETRAERLKQTMQDPKSTYERPGEVLKDEALSDAEKVEILRRWKTDAELLATAEAENMAGGEPNLLHEVSEALATLISQERGAR